MNTEYITVEGDRWDTIATKAYGNAKDFERIVVANPKIPMHRILPVGTRVIIPVIERTDVITETEQLPPWER